MSPTRRDLLKASAGIFAAALLTTPTVEPVVAAPDTLPAGHLRKAEAFCVMGDHGSTDCAPDRQWFSLFMDGDLDNTWTVWVTPGWQVNAITGDRDGDGIINCRGLTANELMGRLWQATHAQPPRILAARPGGGFFHRLTETADDDLRLAVREWWRRTSRTVGDEPALDELNSLPWSLAMWNHPVLDAVPDSNAVIECRGWYFLAQLDKAPVDIPGGA